MKWAIKDKWRRLGMKAEWSDDEPVALDVAFSRSPTTSLSPPPHSATYQSSLD